VRKATLIDPVRGDQGLRGPEVYLTTRDSGSGWMIRATGIAPHPGLRGFGTSTPMLRDFPWTLDLLIVDCCRLMDALGVEPRVRQSMAGCLGSTLPPEGVAWWPTFMGCTAVSTQFGFMQPNRLRLHPGRCAAACLPDAGEYHGGRRAAFRGRHVGLAADDPGFDKVERGAACFRACWADVAGWGR
jgi:hypothetical protein